MKEKQYFVYIMTNQENTVLYTGVTNNLQRRILEHRSGEGGDFTKRYKIYKLVYYETGNDVNQVISREKQLKGGSRRKKIALINEINPSWEDLFDKFFSSKSS
jgi:putative endonuclease